MFKKQTIKKLENKIQELEYKLGNRLVPPKDIRHDILGPDYQLVEKIIKSQKTDYETLLKNLDIKSFLLDKPKAYIGGDFYWVKFNDNKLTIALWDSTGHGLNGAISSLYIVSQLNEMYYCNKNYSAADFLNELDSKLKKLKSEDKNHTAELIMCCFDIENKILNYSGSFIPLGIANNKGYSELPTDRIILGKMDNNKKFENRYFNFDQNDIIYLKTDGYSDQFGGLKGTKYGKKNLADLFMKICDYPIPTQKEELNKELLNWINANKQNEFEQTDDLLIFGIKLTAPNKI